ncbi:MAG: hypothetical protein AAFQ75_16425, partial [Pseudomonadota bacterium]
MSRARSISVDGRRTAWLAETRPADQLFIVTLRRWLDGPEGQQAVWNGLAGEVGPHPARRILQAFERFLVALSHGLVRPITRHPACCACVGADELLLADIVRAAGRGDHETAASRSAEVVRAADRAIVAERAEKLGLLIDDIGLDPVSGLEARARLH